MNIQVFTNILGQFKLSVIALLDYLVLFGAFELFWVWEALPEGPDLFGLIYYRAALSRGYRERVYIMSTSSSLTSKADTFVIEKP